jgi:hypothetical protein
MERQDWFASPYRLFSSRTEIGVCCAVRHDQILPAFIHGKSWIFSGIVADPSQAPTDLNLRAAQASTALTGYHLFLALRS